MDIVAPMVTPDLIRAIATAIAPTYGAVVVDDPRSFMPLPFLRFSDKCELYFAAEWPSGRLIVMLGAEGQPVHNEEIYPIENYTTRITVDPQRNATAIARDVERRLLAKGGKLVKKVIARHTQQSTIEAQKTAYCEELVAVLQQIPTSHVQILPSQTINATVAQRTQQGFDYVEIRVEGGELHSRLTVSGVAPAALRRLIAVLQGGTDDH